MKKHYTKPQFAAALIKLIDGSPTAVLDPAAGDGALLRAATNQWPKISLAGFDISRSALQEAKKNLPPARLSCVNALRKRWNTSDSKRYPLVVCNPPFLGESYLPLQERIDIQFFSRAIDTVKESGVLLFVLPQSIASNPSFRELRSNWLQRNTLKAAIGLPQNAFQNTEANAVAIILAPGKPTARNLVKFVVLGRNAQVVQQAYDRIDSSFRFDPQYYILRNWIPKIFTDVLPLREVSQDIRRGIFVKKAPKNAKNTHSYIHSTNLRCGWISDERDDFVGPDAKTNVDAGCVLLSRVGKGLWKKSALYTAIEPGTASDCVYIVRTSSLVTSGYLAAMLTTKYMQSSIRRLARGITVPILNKEELLELLIPWLPSEARQQFGAAWFKCETNIQRASLTALLDRRISA